MVEQHTIKAESRHLPPRYSEHRCSISQHTLQLHTISVFGIIGISSGKKRSSLDYPGVDRVGGWLCHEEINGHVYVHFH